MQRALEQALERADRVIESAQQRPPKRKASSTGGKSLQEKLYDIYVEECGREPEGPEELMRNVHLLEKLVKRESLPCLVVNLYPGEEGYSLMIKGENELYSETIRLPYDERDFLEYLDAEELPPILVDVLEKTQANFFQSGCVITEVRDYRQCTNTDRSGYQSRHVLLRPTMQTLASDVHSITSDNQIWTQEDRLSLESQLILATAEPLCLDPSVSVACIENKLLYNKQKMNTPPMKRNFKRYSTASLNWQQELSCRSPPPELRAWDFHTKRKERQEGQQDGLRFSKAGSCVDMWKQQPCDLEVPSEVDVDKYAKEERSVAYDDAQPIAWPALEAQDDSLFECGAGEPSHTTNPTFMQSLNDPFISGKRNSHKKARVRRHISQRRSSTDDHSSSSRLESQTGAERAASQTEQLVQNWVAQESSGSASLSQLCPGRAAEQPQAMCIPSAALGKEGQHTYPALSLPCSSGNSSWDNSFPSLQAIRVCEFPSPAPAWQPPNLPKKSSVKGNLVRILPATTVSTASTSPKTPTSKVKARPKVTKVVSPAHAAQMAVRGLTPLKSSTARTKTPIAIKPRIVCSGDQQPAHTQPASSKPPSQGIKIIFKNTPALTPITLFQFPGSFLQPQMATSSQPSSTQTTPGQSPPQQGVLFPAVIQQLSHSQPVQVNPSILPIHPSHFFVQLSA
ncbi:transcription factor SPT20 homolog [Pipistrellus kuhlii]|uniref:transcription factor SPT20 homolog n=1 Tax=Pipistrellus kuhlii TaxID=59472 RepID=UPI00174F5C9A|nr:transcription factor SPT20 homolog [Pipistrellus kuhlii]